MKNYLLKLREKLTEALNSVLPIIGIVMILCFTIAPISSSILLSDGRGHDRRRHHVLHARGGDQYDSHGRKTGYGHYEE